MTFKTKELIFIALMAALLFVLNFTIGAGIIAATGIPASSALIDGITNLAVVTFVALVLRKFGAIALLYLVYAIIALPTHMAGGPPGFILKIPFLAGSALLFDLTIYLLKYRKSGFIIGLPILTLFGFALYIATYYFLGMPEFQKLLTALPVIFVSFTVLGYIGMWIGFKIYNRTKNKRAVLQITS